MVCLYQGTNKEAIRRGKSTTLMIIAAQAFIFALLVFFVVADIEKISRRNIKTEKIWWTNANQSICQSKWPNQNLPTSYNLELSCMTFSEFSFIDQSIYGSSNKRLLHCTFTFIVSSRGKWCMDQIVVVVSTKDLPILDEKLKLVPYQQSLVIKFFMKDKINILKYCETLELIDHSAGGRCWFRTEVVCESPIHS